MKFEDAKILIDTIEKDLKYRPFGDYALVFGRIKNLVLLQRTIPADLARKLEYIYSMATERKIK